MQHHLALLGWAVKDKVTGFTGTVSTIGFDLYGCVQAIVTPKAVFESNGAQKLDRSEWFDVSRLEKIGDQPVMQPIPAKGDRTVAGADNSKPVR